MTLSRTAMLANVKMTLYETVEACNVRMTLSRTAMLANVKMTFIAKRFLQCHFDIKAFDFLLIYSMCRKLQIAGVISVAVS